MQKAPELTIRKSSKRLVIKVPDEVHWIIKNKAHNKNMSLSRYVLQAIQMRIKNEESL
jgi:predicted HicB family RNase H-like nuclease